MTNYLLRCLTLVLSNFHVVGEFSNLCDQYIFIIKLIAAKEYNDKRKESLQRNVTYGFLVTEQYRTSSPLQHLVLLLWLLCIYYFRLLFNKVLRQCKSIRVSWKHSNSKNVAFLCVCLRIIFRYVLVRTLHEIMKKRNFIHDIAEVTV